MTRVQRVPYGSMLKGDPLGKKPAAGKPPAPNSKIAKPKKVPRK